MSGLVIRDKNGENISYSGSRFEGMGDLGTHHLCVRTGSGQDGVIKYALTSKPLDDKYKSLRMRIPDGATGKEAYIAQRYVDTRLVETTAEYTSTRSSEFVSTITNTIQSTTSNATRTATRSASQNPVYYGILPMTQTSSKEANNLGTYSSTNSFTQRLSFLMNYSLSKQTLAFISGASSSSSYITASTNNTYTVSMSVSGTRYLDHNVLKSALNICSVTRTVTSRVSTFVQNFVSSIASRTSTQTINTSRASGYTSSSSASATETFMSHNVDL